MSIVKVLESSVHLIKLGLVIMLLNGCNGSAEQSDKKGEGEGIIELKISTEQTFQTVHNFGASDAWSIQFVGKNWPEESRQEISNLLFSTREKADGSPVGIGLSAWRFNIGAGSTEQGDQSEITDEWRRAECFLDAQGNYDWSKQEGQLWFLKEAKAQGVTDFVGFVNSPPVHYTTNGKAWSADGLSSNLPADRYEDYAVFLSDVIQGVASSTGVEFNYLSPFNEPQWEWKCCGQEGSPWNNEELANATGVIDSLFTIRDFSTKIEVTEAGQIDYFFSETKEPNLRNDQVKAFFDPNSSSYVGDLEHVAHKIAGHSYWSTWDLETLKKSRSSLRQKIEEIDPTLEYWMSEYCLLEDNEEVKGGGRDLGIEPALYMARVIQADMLLAQANAWHWWLAVSPYDYKDGLVYIDHDKNAGKVYESKMLWALGHFSRFIRPGSVRVLIERVDGTSVEEAIGDLVVSAYRTPEKEIVIVLLNQRQTDEVVSFAGLTKSPESISVYQTTAVSDENMKRMSTDTDLEGIHLPARSLVTCVIK